MLVLNVYFPDDNGIRKTKDGLTYQTRNIFILICVPMEADLETKIQYKY